MQGARAQSRTLHHPDPMDATSKLLVVLNYIRTRMPVLSPDIFKALVKQNLSMSQASQFFPVATRE
jgi:hypothetical protein